jgi:hypothetical protein
MGDQRELAAALGDVVEEDEALVLPRRATLIQLPCRALDHVQDVGTGVIDEVDDDHTPALR